MMKKLSIICVSLIGLIGLNCSCGKVATPVPIAKVNFTVAIYSCKLVHVGEHEYFTGAIKGLIVYRIDMQNFCAYDRACSYDYKAGGYVSVDDNNPFQLICGSCHSTYNILTGYPIGEVKAEAPLRAYKATMIDDFNLRVQNY